MSGAPPPTPPPSTPAPNRLAKPVWRPGVEPIAVRSEPDWATASRATVLNRGLLVMDKPAGCTSHDVVDFVRRVLHMRRVGHSGTLDPEVTGVLPIGLGQATAILSLLLEAGKTYDCEMWVHDAVPEDRLRETLMKFLGEITQRPPVRSRVKRVDRQREIYRLDIQRIERRKVWFQVECEAGTYIRKLCHDVGVALGCGAHMAKLRRVAAGGFTLGDAWTEEQLVQAVGAARSDDAALRRIVRPLEHAIGPEWPRLWVDDGCLASLACGSSLGAPGVLASAGDWAAGDDVAIFTASGWLVELAVAQMSAAEISSVTRGWITKPKRVFWPLNKVDAETESDTPAEQQSSDGSDAGARPGDHAPPPPS